ncbi:Crp/Fnr family transcriptional regulator [Flavobacterium luminosum]|uniref:Crp/Fnr family transcriptional regulator n=1 Tax=Flavobacterium luminosum TaxID=2949086 RepID=A0ABT0TP45_9FLAO|nr:Crp/Fnr family transcriptional regulator [Flavobacterium sp. HXWNR70]MCL9808829.1 Crp/Fnr family transcriptional regulator [Flavobacterium sp. HXWNR70]
MNPIEFLTSELNAKDLYNGTLDLKRNALLNHHVGFETNIYFIESGSVKIFFLNNDEEHIIRFGYQNNLITFLDSFLTGGKTDFYIQTLKKTTVKYISKTQFMDFLHSNEIYLKIWLELLEALLFDQLEREKDILIQSPKERYKRVLKRSPKLFQEIPNTHIANYLRMSPETLSRLKNLDLNQGLDEI